MAPGAGMRVANKIHLVGALPTLIAALIALAGWLLLTEAERARSGAVLAGAAYRDQLVARAARDDYADARAGERAPQAERFADVAEQARGRLAALEGFARTADQQARVAAARAALEEYVARMAAFVRLTQDNDALIEDMGIRARTLIGLTDQARRRQHASNAQIVSSLGEKDRRLRLMREVVERAHALRANLSAAELGKALTGNPVFPVEARERNADLNQIRNAVRDLAEGLRADRRPREAEELTILASTYEAREGERMAFPPLTGDATEQSRTTQPSQALQDWSDRLLKVDSSIQRALQDELAQLLTYAVEANETEQATQNVAIATLKLSQRTANALAARDPAAATPMLEEGRDLSATTAALPISALIQTEMIDAIDGWRERLRTTIEGIRRQNAMIADMDRLADAMIESARTLDETFTGDAERFGVFLRHLLLVGATLGLVIGAGTALVVARAITARLRRLQASMLAMAADPMTGSVPEAERRDELGQMARAANTFVNEIRRREGALRRAKERADAALAQLRQTQADLIRSEKLASLGQLVAGVAHEINTPLGIALTTATSVRAEAGEFQDALAGGGITRTRLTHFVARMREGAQLMTANLTRAADLVHGFKQVAVDQVSDERRTVPVKVWLDELVHSLGPLLRQGRHAAGVEACVEAPDDLVADIAPGALAQVVTNLVKNAVVHAFAAGEAGRITVRLLAVGPALLRLEVEDDGRGIAPADRERIFDPFYTTARHRGSTGLGLHIVHNLVTGRLGGRIEIDAAPVRGTLFRITFPAQAQADASPAIEAIA